MWAGTPGLEVANVDTKISPEGLTEIPLVLARSPPEETRVWPPVLGLMLTKLPRPATAARHRPR